MGCLNSKGAVDEKYDKFAEAGVNPAVKGGAAALKTVAQNRFPWNWPVGAEQVGYLSERQVKARLKIQAESVIELPGGLRFRYAAISQRGYYPSQADKPNQDAFSIQTNLEGPGKHWFAVYDGHGPVGEKCSAFACDQIVTHFSAAVKEGSSSAEALKSAHLKTNELLARKSDIDDQQSGTTAVTMYLDGSKITVSNVGDSRCMIGTEAGDEGVAARSISLDQTPYRRDERERVKKYGARVMTADQIDGVEPIHENWECNLGDEIDDGGDPPRIWAKDSEYPGTAFTRSIGDSLAEALGVVAEPELHDHEITAADKCIIVASDGIFEFITTKQCIDVALLYSDPLEACKALVGESYKLWIEREDRTDDITIICGFVESSAAPSAVPSRVSVGGEAALADIKLTEEPTSDKKKKTRRGSLQQPTSPKP